jgi:hypothetical protein
MQTKLSLIQETVDSLLKPEGRRPGRTPGYFDPQIALEPFERYAPLRDDLKQNLPEAFTDLPVRPLPKPSGTTDFGGRGYLTRNDLGLLLSDVNACIALIPVAQAEEHPVTREGILFQGSYYQSMRYLEDFILEAATSIKVIDGYFFGRGQNN